MGGSIDIYRKILARYLESEKGAFEKILLDISDGKLEEAVRGAHTMKGVAGMIGATVLCADATELEAALSDGDEVLLEELIPRTRKTFNETLEAVKTAISTKVSERNKSDKGVLSKAELLDELKKIAERVGNFDSTVEDAAGELASRVEDPKLGVSLRKLKYALGAYNFDAANALLDEILRSLIDN